MEKKLLAIFTLWLSLMTSATVQANPFLGMIPESLCQKDYHSNTYQPRERQLDTSLTLELKPGSYTGPCKQLLEAPPSHGLYVRVYPVNSGGATKLDHAALKNMNTEGQTVRNSTSTVVQASCPLTIYQPSHKSVAPWRFDPCQANAGEVGQLLTSPLRIVWQHGQNWPKYRLTVTAYGQGEVCEQEGRHSCLKVGLQKMVCISDQLICDGVQNCPAGSEFESDEGKEACESVEKRKSQLFNYLKEIFQNGLPSSFRRSRPSGSLDAVNESMVEQHHATTFTLTRNDINKTFYVETVIDRSSSIRKNFAKGLSQYGSWGYLMLGMLLCGGALLVCGLWECCCRKPKPVAPLSATSLDQQPQQVMDVNVISNSFAAMQQQNRSDSLQAVINYDETEPPPSYAILFPNQKSTEDLTQIATSSRYPRPTSVAE